MPIRSPANTDLPPEREQSDNATAGVVLAGGASRRMGTDKALLVVDGELLLERAARRLEAAGASTVVIACGTPDRYGEHTDRPLIPDPAGHEGDGPLAGLAAAFAHLAPTHRIGLVLAVDLVDADPALLAGLADRLHDVTHDPATPSADAVWRATRPVPGAWPSKAGRDGDGDDAAGTPAAVVPLDGTGRAQPLHAAYDIRRALPILTAALDRGERRVLPVVLGDLRAITVDGPHPSTTTDWSRNLNRPEDRD